MVALFTLLIGKNVLRTLIDATIPKRTFKTKHPPKSRTQKTQGNRLKIQNPYRISRQKECSGTGKSLNLKA